MIWRMILYCLLAGISIMWAGLQGGAAAIWWLHGAVLAGAFVPIVYRGPHTFWRRWLMIWLCVLTCSVLGTWLEAIVFVQMTPQQKITWLGGSFLVYTILSLVLALLAKPLHIVQPSAVAPLFRTGLRIPLAIVLAGVVYLVCYEVFGGMAYQFFTKPYYDSLPALSGSVQTVQHLGFWFPLLEVGRGVLLTLGCLPAIYATRMGRWKLAVIIGMLLWVTVGLAPLLLPNPIMPGRLRFYHTLEIFTQNFPLGIAAVLLLTRKPAATHSSVDQPAAVTG